MFYHVSKNDHGEKFRFIPKLPESAIIHKEGNIPRVCVSEEIYYCLRSICDVKELYSMDIILKCIRSTDGYNPLVVYTTNLIPYLPPNISDFWKNREYWFIKPIIMKRLGYIDLNELSKGKIKLIDKFKLFTNEELSGESKDVKISFTENYDAKIELY